MNGINRVFIMGYLGADPELLTSKTGKPYLRMSISTHHNRKLASGERETSTTWHRVMVWGKNAERYKSWLQRGSALAVEGYLSKFKYEKEDGSEASSTSIVAREVHFLEKKSTVAPSETAGTLSPTP